MKLLVFDAPTQVYIERGGRLVSAVAFHIPVHYVEASDDLSVTFNLNGHRITKQFDVQYASPQASIDFLIVDLDDKNATLEQQLIGCAPSKLEYGHMPTLDLRWIRAFV